MLRRAVAVAVRHKTITIDFRRAVIFADLEAGS